MGELRVVRHTNHFDEGCRFYGEVLGWPVTRQWDEPRRGRIFGHGATARVELIDASEPEAAVSGVYVAVEVDDVAGVHRAVQASGVEITAALADQPWGHRNFGVLDPTGLTVVFFQVLAAAVPGGDA